LKLSRILVPITGTSTDEPLIRLACALAKKEKARIYAIHVIELSWTLPLEAELEPEIERGEQILDKAEITAEQEDCQIETELVQARSAGPALVDEAISKECDLILMAIPYKKRFGEFNLGKTAPYILKNAPCRVWICRDPIG